MKLKLLLFLFLFAMIITTSFGQVSSSKEADARRWITEHSKELNIQPFHKFSLSFVRKSLSGETLRFQQMINNVPVFQSEIVIHYSPNDEITNTTFSFDSEIKNISTLPSITTEAAISKSDLALNLTKSDFSFQESNLYVVNIEGQTKLVYIIITNPNSGIASWETRIDAQTGEVISVKDVAIYHHKKEDPIKKKDNKVENSTTLAPAFVGGTAMVYMSDPLSFAQVPYGGNYVDNNDATNASLDAARTSVVLPEIDLQLGTYRLKSTYVEIKDFESPTKGLFTQATNDYNFTRDNDAFEAVNVFYHLDKSLRYINETLGIVCKPSLNSGVLHFDPSGLSGADNSHYIPAQDRLAFGEGCVDDAEDADVIWHEFGHGIHDWLTNGNTSNLIGEGNGDYWAQSYSRSLNQWLPTDPAHQYMFSWDGHNTCWTGRSTNYTAIYPAGLTGAIHTDGQIWATALMRIYDVIGRTKTDKAFLEGLALTNSSSNQQVSAIAVRQAAIDMNFSCADIKTMTDKFTLAGYTMPAVALKINCPGNQTVNADGSNLYTVPSFAALANAISPNCDAVVTQSLAVGSTVPPGTYPVTMTATSGTAVTCTFNLIVQGALGINPNTKSNVAIYPNPTKNILTIKGEFDANESIIIYNLLGQKVMETAIKSNEEKVDVSKLSEGVYSIYFKTSKATHKFIKE